MKTAIHMIATLTILGALAGGLLSFVAGWAAPKIAQHRQEDTEKAIYLVQTEGNKFEKVKNVDFDLFMVFNTTGDTVGYAMPIEGTGFQGKIRMMLGVKTDLQEITGLEILEQSETPGLGDRIREDGFRQQFVKLIANPLVEWIKGVKPEKANQIQTITGATISSKAVVAIINDNLAKLRSSINAGGNK
ncbi:MAG: FMN-binding protein [bacterium]